MKRNMNNIIVSFVLGVFIFIPFFASAHNVHIAQFEIQEQDGHDYLVVNFTLKAFKEVLKNEKEYQLFADIEDIKTLEALAARYIKSRVDIKVNGESLVFGKEMIKLGHSSVLRLEIQNLPEEVHSVVLNIPCFEQMAHQKNIFVIQKEDFKFQESLKAENGFQSIYANYTTSDNSKFSLYNYLAISIILLIIFLFLSLIKYQPWTITQT